MSPSPKPVDTLSPLPAARHAPTPVLSPLLEPDMTALYTPPDLQAEADRVGVNCGAGALSAASGRTVTEVMDAVLAAERGWSGYTTYGAALSAAARLGLRILSMQRPDRTVFQGIIKANVLHRVALKLPQAVDSRIVLDCGGAEALLGKGDLLYLDASGRLERLQVPFLEGGTKGRWNLQVS